MILVAALCLSLREFAIGSAAAAAADWWIDEYRRFQVEAASLPPMSDEDYQFSVRSLEYYLSDEFQTWLTAALIALTSAQLLMRLRRPRPEWHRLIRQPGFVACGAAAIGFCIDKGWVPYIRLESLHFPFMTTLAVLIAWSALLGLRVCLAEKSWIDRLGRLVGVGWIISGPISQIEQYYLW